MERSDIVLINVGGTRKRVYQELSKAFSAVDTPFWLALTAAYLRNCGFRVAVVDANAENLSFEETADHVNDSGAPYAAVICYSQQANVATPIMVAVGDLCKTLKDCCPECSLILTGWHPSALPERTLREEACDYVVQGEGFYTLRGLLQGDEPESIPGLWWVDENDHIHNSGRAPNVEDLDGELPDVAWDLLPMKESRYRAFNWMCLGDLQSRNRFASLFTSLGCPFRCTFCAIHSTYGEHKLRCWSPSWALRQIDTLVNEYDVKNINFHDELFVFRKDHFLAIAEGLIERNYGLNICAFARVDILDKLSEDALLTLKRAGFNWFKLGIESADEEILKNCRKGGFKRKTVERVVKKVHSAGIDLCANFMFGLPGDTQQTMRSNLEFAKSLRCAFPSFFCTMAIPGSELYDQALRDGIPLPKTWLGYASQGYEFKPLPTETLSAAEVLAFRDYAFDDYFSDPAYLDMIEAKFGVESRDHIKAMTGIKLKRRLLEEASVAAERRQSNV